MATALELDAVFETRGEDKVLSALDCVDHRVGEVGRSSQRSSGLLKNIFTNAAGVATGTIFAQIASHGPAMIGSLLGANKVIENIKVGLKGATGSAKEADTIFANIQKMAAASPFETEELGAAALRLENMGLSSEKWLGTIGDTTAALKAQGVTVDQVTSAVTDATMGNFVRMQELGVDAVTKNGIATFKYIDKAGKEQIRTVDANNRAMVEKTVQGIFNDKYSGAMKNFASTYDGIMSTLRDNVSMKLASMSEGFFQTVKGSASFLNDVFAVGWDDALDLAFGEGSTSKVAAFAHGLDDAARAGIDFAGVMKDAFGNGARVKELVATLPEPLQGTAMALGKVADGFGDVFRAAQAGDWGWVADEIWDTVKNAGGSVVDAGRVAISAGVDLAGELLSVSDDAAGWLWGKIGGWNGVVMAGAAVLSAGLGLGGEIAGAATDLAGWAWTQIGGWGGIIEAGTAVISAGLDLGGEISSMAADAGGWLRGKLTANWDQIVALPGVTIDATLKLAADIGASEVAVSIAEAVVSAVEGLTSLGGDVASAVAGLIGGTNWASVFTVDSFNLGESLGVALRGAVGTAISEGGDVIRELADLDWSAVPGAIAKGIVAAAVAAPLATAAITTGIASFVAGAFTGFAFGEEKPDFDAVVSAITGGITEAFNGVKDFGHGILVAIAAGLTPGDGDFGLEGDSISGALFTAITQSIPGKGFDVLMAIAGSLVVSPGDFASEGAAIASNIWEGVKDWFHENADPRDLPFVPGSSGNDDSEPEGGKDGGAGGGAKTEYGFLPQVSPPDIAGLLGGIDVDTPVVGLMDSIGAAVSVALGADGGPFRGISDAAMQAMADMSSQANQGALSFAASLLPGYSLAGQATTGAMSAMKLQVGTLGPGFSEMARSATIGMVGELVGGFGLGTLAAASGAAAIKGSATSGFGGVADEYGGFGANAGQSLADALYGKVGAVSAAGQALADAAAGGVRGGLQIGSPSKIMGDYGTNAVDSFLSPFLSRRGEVDRVMSDTVGMRSGSAPTFLPASSNGPRVVVVQQMLRSNELIDLMAAAETGRDFAVDYVRELEL